MIYVHTLCISTERRLHPTAQLIASKLTRLCSLDAKGQVAIETRPDPGNINLPSPLPLTPNAHPIRQTHYSIFLSGRLTLGDLGTLPICHLAFPYLCDLIRRSP